MSEERRTRLIATSITLWALAVVLGIMTMTLGIFEIFASPAFVLAIWAAVARRDSTL